MFRRKKVDKFKKADNKCLVKKDAKEENGTNTDNNNDNYYRNEYNHSDLGSLPESGRGSSGSVNTYLSSSIESSNRSLSQLSLSNSNIVCKTKARLIFVVDAIRCRFIALLAEEEKHRLEDENDDEILRLYDCADIDALKKPLLGEYNKNDSSNDDLACQQWQAHLATRLIIRYIDQAQIDEVTDESVEKLIDTLNKLDQIEKAANSLGELLKFRQSYQLNHLTNQHFPRQFYKLNGIFTFGRDKNDIPVLYISAHVHRKWSAKLDNLFRQFVAWHMNRITNSGLTDDKQGNFVMCFDCNKIGYSSVDLDFLKFMVALLVNYYPTFCKYCLIKDNPWVFRYIWTLVKTWLPEEARNNVHMITAKELTDFISLDQIPNCMKVNDFYKKPENNMSAGDDSDRLSSSTSSSDSGRFELPTNWEEIKDIDTFQEELNLSQDEMKKFKNHVELIEKEYLALGAV